MTTFQKKLVKLIKKFGMENNSDTPDFILARFLENCLVAFDNGINSREEWYGNKKGDKKEWNAR